MSWTISVDGLEFHDISMEHQTQLNSSMMKQKLTQQHNLRQQNSSLSTKEHTLAQWPKILHSAIKIGKKIIVRITYGIQNDSGTHTSSASIVPLSFVSVAAHGEWSTGKILDVYLKFAMRGD
ncbi:hypothetical protein ACHAW6_008670 [Cyclotella cf. meneghiniana]